MENPKIKWMRTGDTPKNKETSIYQRVDERVDITNIKGSHDIGDIW